MKHSYELELESLQQEQGKLQREGDRISRTQAAAERSTPLQTHSSPRSAGQSTCLLHCNTRQTGPEVWSSSGLLHATRKVTMCLFSQDGLAEEWSGLHALFVALETIRGMQERLRCLLKKGTDVCFFLRHVTCVWVGWGAWWRCVFV